ncbi:MAG TPA: cyclodeaminase/cyclohydrolase family protein [Streptosporangiaceae bacterium]
MSSQPGQPDPGPQPSPARPGAPTPGPGQPGYPGGGPDGYLNLPVGQFLAALSAPTPDPGGGAVAALAVTLAASLCAMTSALSARRLAAAEPEAEPLAARATRLRDEAAPLAEADVARYRAVLAAQRAGDSGAIQAALSAACDVPMRVTELGAEVAAIAAAVAADGNPAVRGDAITAALLAAAGASSAAALVRINLAQAPGDARPGRAGRLAAEATRLATEASRLATSVGS